MKTQKKVKQVEGLAKELALAGLELQRMSIEPNIKRYVRQLASLDWNEAHHYIIDLTDELIEEIREYAPEEFNNNK